MTNEDKRIIKSCFCIGSLECRKNERFTRDYLDHLAEILCDALEQPEIIHCPDCKYYYAPVCTFYRSLPMTSRHGYCHHAVKGKYEGDVPVVRPEPEIIHCKDCKNSFLHRIDHGKKKCACIYFEQVFNADTDFCSQAKRREE